MRSLEVQGVDVQVALCSAADDPATQAIADRFDHLIAFQRLGPDAGQSASINEGWQAIDGDIYGWLNCDDALRPGALSAVCEYFSSHPELSVVYGQSLIIRSDGAITGGHPSVEPPSERLYYHNIVSQPSAFIHREALFEIGLVREDLHYTMDWDLFVRLKERSHSFFYTGDTYSSVVWETGTKTSQFSTKRYEEIWGVLSRNCTRVRRIKSMVGFAQHHLATYRENGRLPASGDWSSFVTGEQASVPLFHYGRTAHALEIAGATNLDIRIDGEPALLDSFGNGTVVGTFHAAETIMLTVLSPPRQIPAFTVRFISEAG